MIKKEETKEYFIPANILEIHTMPQDTLLVKLSRLIGEMLKKEEGIEPPHVLIQKHVFNKQQIGYDVISKITWR